MIHREALLHMEGIDKSFPGVHALKGVNLVLHAGEVLGVVGENGAGKSTLIKILAGVHIPDGGRVLIDGRPVGFSTPSDAQRAGIAVIYQEFNLIPALTVRENLLLGHERARLGFISKRDEKRRAQELLLRLRAPIDLEARCRDLSVAEQQIVEIAKALSQGARLLVMDEPTAALSPPEVKRLFELVRDLKRDGIGIIYISHRLEEVFDIADRITVLRDGSHVGTHDTTRISRDALIELMVGRSIDREFPKVPAPIGEFGLQVVGLQRMNRPERIDFGIRRGEVLGLTGLVGSGRTEVARMVFGADPRRDGRISLDGRELDIRSPRDAIRSGICLLTEDRKGQGLVLMRSVLENFALPSLSHWSQVGFINRRRERSVFSDYVRRLDIRTADENQVIRDLSGGNQQKVLLARWLESRSEVVIFDEPTRGIDVGAKYEIYLLMNRLAASGKAILMISSELPEILGMSDRILVMKEGRIAGEISDVPSATQESLLAMAAINR